MKRFCFLFILGFVFNLIHGQTWTEDWEGEWESRWEIEGGVWEVGLPIAGPSGPFEGFHVLGTNLSGNYPRSASTRIISDTITIPNGPNPHLRFQHWFSFNSADYGQVHIRRKDSSQWILLNPQNDFNQYYGTQWTQVIMDLSAYAGEEVQLAFYFYAKDNCAGSCSDESHGWFIDDIRIEDQPFEFNNPETWENGIGDWFVSEGTWQVGKPTSGPSAYEGDNVAGTILNGNYGRNIGSRLISPLFTIPNGPNPHLRFQHWFSFNSADYGQVHIRRKDESEWVSLNELLGLSDFSQYYGTRWTQVIMDLSAYAGEEVQLAFYFYAKDNCAGSCSDESHGWFIDDIRIEDQPFKFNNPETWENGIGDWFVSEGTWQVGKPTSGPSAYEGDNVAGTILNGNYGRNIGSRLISPLFTIPNGPNPHLRFQHWFSFNSADYGQVHIRRKDESEWVSLNELLGLSDFSQYYGTRWTQVIMDLSAYAGEEVQLAFYFYAKDNCAGSCSDESHGWFIDDIRIEDQPFEFNNPETWENGIGDWFVSEGTWQVGKPTSGPSAYEGDNVAGTILNGNYGRNIGSRLISPLFTIPNGPNPHLRFQHWFSFNSADYGQVHIRRKDESEWVSLNELLGLSDFSQYYGTRWTQVIMDLSAYAGEEVQLAFYFYAKDNCAGSCSDESHGWFIDDIRIEDQPFEFNNPETWENGIGDWFVSEGTWQVGKPTSGPSAYEGDNVAGTILNGNYGRNIGSRLISPLFTIPNGPNPHLRFQHWFSFNSADYGQVHIRRKDESEWVSLNELLGLSDFSQYYGTRWTQVIMDLSAYAGEEVQLAFYFYAKDNCAGSCSDESHGWFIDDIRIEDQPFEFNNPETWENGIGDWFVSEGTWQVGKPTSGPSAYEGDNVAGTILNGNYGRNIGSRLISPLFTIPNGPNPHLRFQHWFSFNSADYGQVHIRRKDESEWVSLNELLGLSDFSQYYGTRWTQVIMDLSAYAGEEVQLAFYFYAKDNCAGSCSDESHGWFIDDIRIEDQPFEFNNPETWENGIGDWFVSEGTWQVGKPTSGPSAYEGDNVAGTILNGNYGRNIGSRLISPLFTIPNGPNPHLRFQHWFSFNSADYGQVHIRRKDESEWVSLNELLGLSDFSQYYGTRWTQVIMDLSAYAGEEVQLAFYFYAKDNCAGSCSDESHGWFIDDIRIEDQPFEFNNPETWENGIGDWFVSEGTWQVGKPTSGPSAYEGDNVAGTILNGNYGRNIGSRLISPLFTIPNGPNPHLRFQHWFSFNSADYGQVHIRRKDESEWVSLNELLGLSDFSQYYGTRWTQVIMDLSAYAGEEVQLAFYFYAKDNCAGSCSDESHGWFIDDIRIEDQPFKFNNPETWENGIGDWFVSEGTWQVGKPTSGPSAYEGDNVAGTILNGNYGRNIGSRLISPLFTIPNGPNPHLRFQHWFSFNSADYGQVHIRRKDESEWVSLNELLGLSDFSQYYGTRWTQVIMDLSAYAGEEVQLAFYFYAKDNCAGSCSDESHGWFIDDIRIEDQPFEFNNPETWENGIGDWFVSEGTWQVGKPTSGPSAYEGDNVAGTILNGNYGRNIGSRLISPLFTIPNGPNPHLRFQHWFSFNSADYGQVHIRRKDSSQWILLNPQNDFNQYYGTQWTQVIMDLSAYAGEEVQLAFYFYAKDNCAGSCSDESHGWFIDDIRIEDQPFEFNNPETWENGIGDWHVSEGTWMVGKAPGSYEGEYSAGTVVGGPYHNNTSTRLISPPFTPSLESCSQLFTFMHWHRLGSGDFGQVQIRINRGDWLDQLGPYTGFSETWKQDTIDLTTYADSIVEIAFLFRSDGSRTSSGWYLDSLTLPTDLDFRIRPDSAYNVGIQSLRVFGEGFTESTSIQLSKAGEPKLHQIDSLSNFVDCIRIQTAFDFKSRAPGLYDVIAFDGSTPIDTLPQGFRIIAPAIYDISPGVGLNIGNVTIKLEGAGFSPDMEVSLENENALILATELIVRKPNEAYATFNLLGEDIGQYDILFSRNDGFGASLIAAFEIQEGGGVLGGGGLNAVGNSCPVPTFNTDHFLVWNLVAPPVTRPGWVVCLQVNYENTGGIDIPVPIRILVSEGGAPISFSEEELLEAKTHLILEFKEENGPPGVLRAGAKGSISIYAKASAPLIYNIIN